MATQSKSEECDARENLAQIGKRDIDHYCADTSVVAIGIVALTKDGRYRTSAGVMPEEVAPDFGEFSDRFEAAVRAEFGRRG